MSNRQTLFASGILAACVFLASCGRRVGPLPLLPLSTPTSTPTPHCADFTGVWGPVPVTINGIVYLGQVQCSNYNSTAEFVVLRSLADAVSYVAAGSCTTPSGTDVGTVDFAMYTLLIRQWQDCSYGTDRGCGFSIKQVCLSSSQVDVGTEALCTTAAAPILGTYCQSVGIAIPKTALPVHWESCGYGYILSFPPPPPTCTTVISP